MRIAERRLSAMSAQPSLRRNSRANLERILDEMLVSPEAHDVLAAEMDRDFAEVRTVMVLDMSGFSRTTQRCGIAAFLLMIHRMKRLACPIVLANGGVVVKAEADDLYCLFKSPVEAIAAAREIIARMNEANPDFLEDRRLYASIGIGHGRILNLDEDDIFGDEVNLAGKLGEDVAESGTVLLTGAARAEAAKAGIATREESISISGLSLGYHVLI
jgi:class 3 adenylate cyclase